MPMRMQVSKPKDSMRRARATTSASGEAFTGQGIRGHEGDGRERGAPLAEPLGDERAAHGGAHLRAAAPFKSKGRV